jgi:hypothetical protein
MFSRWQSNHIAFFCDHFDDSANADVMISFLRKEDESPFFLVLMYVKGIHNCGYHRVCKGKILLFIDGV